MISRGKYIFISGIPTSGKSFLAKKISNELGILHFDTDKWRGEVRSNSDLVKWVDFYFDKDEEEYFKNTDCNRRWDDLKNQSEVFWPIFKMKIDEIIESNFSAIFEGVTLLPHLIHEDFKFPAYYLLGESFEQTLDRNIKSSRWGKTLDLQKIEAENFFYCEGENYKREAEAHGYKIFRNIYEAEKDIKKYFIEQ